MRRYPGRAVLVLLVSAWAGVAAAQTPSPRLESVFPALAAGFRERVEQAGIVGSSLLVVRDGRIAAEGVVGFADIERRRPPDRDTIYHWASITKTLTGIAIMQLRDEGRLGLDDPAVRYLPELRRIHNPFGDISQVTIRMLLTHSAGFRNGTWPFGGGQAWEPFEPTEWAQLVAMMPYTRVLFPPGSKQSYSNPGLVYLGRILEILSGEDYEMYVTKRILNPLGMHASFFDRAPRHLLPHRSRSYFRDDEGLREAAFDFDTGITVSNGGLNAPLADMARYLAFLMGDDAKQADYDLVLKRASLEEMWVPGLPVAEDEGGYGPEARMGLTFFIERHQGLEFIAHSGNQNGFLSHFYIHRPSRTAYIVAFNTDASSKAKARPAITREVDGAIRDLVVREVFLSRK